MSNKTLRKNKGFGWIPDRPDARNLLFSAPLEILLDMPTEVDLRPQCPPIYDQGKLNCCTGNVIAAAIEFDLIKQNLQDFIPSRLFIYYNERDLEGTVTSDAGAMISDGFRSINQKGVCPETEWTYDDDTSSINSKYRQIPSQQCYTDALNTKAISYSQIIQNLNQMKGCLASGYPFVFGFAVYQSFIDAWHKDAIIPMPLPRERPYPWHAALAVGFDDSQCRFICRNSWGTHDTGMDGYFTMPYAYLSEESLAKDFWTVKLVS
jgi:C1A family cysteine protease